jgi:hypothetical protein
MLPTPKTASVRAGRKRFGQHARRHQANDFAFEFSYRRSGVEMTRIPLS